MGVPLIEYLIDIGREHDQGLIRKSWLNGYWGRKVGATTYRPSALRGVRRGIYVKGQHRRIACLLPRCQVLVARPPDWPEGILGYAVFSLPSPGMDGGVLHWWEVKRRYRRFGVGRALLHSAMEVMGVQPGHRTPEELAERDPRGAPRCSHNVDSFCEPLWSRGFVFDPYAIERILDEKADC